MITKKTITDKFNLVIIDYLSGLVMISGEKEGPISFLSRLLFWSEEMINI